MMRRFISLVLLLLLALPALSEGSPVFSRDAQALQTANAILYERYGLTPHLLGLFDVEITRYGDVAVVRYLPRSRPHPSLTGEYLVLIDSDGAQALWTHDGADPALWQSGALNSSVWGAPQLLKYLEAGSFDREYFDAPYAPSEPENPLDRITYGVTDFESITGDLTEAEYARPAAIGRAAVQAMYSLSDEAAAEMHLVNAVLYLFSDGNLWALHFYHDTLPDEINYTAYLDGDSFEVLRVTVHTGGIG